MKTLKILIRSAIVVTLLLLTVSIFTGPAEALTPFVPLEAPAVEVDVDGAGVVHEASGSISSHDGAGELQSQGLVGNLVTLVLLVLLQAVLGFDNLLYISLESKHAPPEQRASVRAWGIGIAIVLRIVLLFVLWFLKDMFETTSVFKFAWPFANGNFNLHSLIVLAGGTFIIYTAMKEIWHMTRLEHDSHGGGEEKKKSVFMIIFWICLLYTSPSPRDQRGSRMPSSA